MSGNAREPEAGNGSPVSGAHAQLLVWRQIDRWRWETECGRYRIERFIPGLYEGIRESDQPLSRYRVLKRNPEWDFQFAQNEGTLTSAQHTCEEHVR